MINVSLSGAHGMRAVLRSGKDRGGIAMTVRRDYEVSKQTALAAWRVRKWGRRGGQGAIAGTTWMITRLRRLQIGHVVGDGHDESSAGTSTSSVGCLG
jgi:hypothetical protein